MTESAIPKHITNPYPPVHPGLRQAFEEGVLAARPGTSLRDYVCATREENRAWLKGFVRTRMANR